MKRCFLGSSGGGDRSFFTGTRPCRVLSESWSGTGCGDGCIGNGCPGGGTVCCGCGWVPVLPWGTNASSPNQSPCGFVDILLCFCEKVPSLSAQSLIPQKQEKRKQKKGGKWLQKNSMVSLGNSLNRSLFISFLAPILHILLPCSHLALISLPGTPLFGTMSLHVYIFVNPWSLTVIPESHFLFFFLTRALHKTLVSSCSCGGWCGVGCLFFDCCCEALCLSE